VTPDTRGESIAFKHPDGDHSRLILALVAIREKPTQNFGRAWRRFNITPTLGQARHPSFKDCLVNTKASSNHGQWHLRRLQLGNQL
jgi:hypothetical protein